MFSAVDRSRWIWNTFGFLFLIPLAVLAVQSVALRWFFPQLIPAEWQLEMTFDVLNRNEVRSALWTSTVIAAMATAVSLLVGLPAAWVLATKRLPGRSVIIGLLVSPQLLPPLTASMGLNISFLKVGISGGLIPVVIAHLVPVLPFVIGIASVTFSRLEQGYILVGRGLGLRPVEVWRRIIWPLSRMGIGLAAYVGFVISWSQYLLTLFVGGGRVVSLPMLVLSSGSGSNLSLFSALAFLMSIVPIGLFLLVRRGPQGV